ncbi:hypothetical protein [Gemmata sp.]|uniref:hypothetical protein n=1 Tax=Gemmata sp. TaxID=1914242 RepID=UPI003F71AD41
MSSETQLTECIAMWSENSFIHERLPELMLEYLRNKVSDRKLRLIACACFRRNPIAMTKPINLWKLDVVERYVDGLATPQEFDDAGIDIGRNSGHLLAFQRDLPLHLGFLVSGTANDVASYAVGDGWESETKAAWFAARDAERLILAAITRCAVGPLPFRTVSFFAEWRTSTVVAIAQQMYDSRDFSVMPILADALQDAGCDNDDILDHCRGPGPHVRGCWVADLVLGKA